MKPLPQAWQGHTANVADSVSCSATAIHRTSGAGGCRAPGTAAPKEPSVLQEHMETFQRPLQLLRLGKRRWAVMPQAAGCTIGTGTPLGAAGKALAATHLIGLFITSYNAHSLDVGVARVVDASLNALVQGPAIWGCLVTEPGIDGWRQVAGHAVVVPPQVWVFSTVGGDTNKFFGARGQLGAGRQLQTLQGKGKGEPKPRAGTEPRQESTGKSGPILREWLLIKHKAGPQGGRTCQVSSGAT